MQHLEKNAVEVVARVAPWLAPFPSAFFVARSAMTHLALPLAVAVVVAAIIETLGLSTVHTALWCYDWNSRKRKTDPAAPLLLAVALGAVYVVATLGLVVFLEVWPVLSVYAPALFPALAVVGALNLALVSRQRQRELAVQVEKAERKAERQARRQAGRQDERPVERQVARSVERQVERIGQVRAKAARMEGLISALAREPEAGPAAWARAAGLSRTTVYSYLDELEEAGRIDRSNGTIQIVGVDHGE